MTIQLCVISIIYFVFNTPWIVVILCFEFGLPFESVIGGMIYGKYVIYFIIFSFPLVTFLSLSELRVKFLEKIHYERRKRRVGFITTNTLRTKTDEMAERVIRQWALWAERHFRSIYLIIHKYI